MSHIQDCTLWCAGAHIKTSASYGKYLNGKSCKFYQIRRNGRINKYLENGQIELGATRNCYRGKVVPGLKLSPVYWVVSGIDMLSQGPSRLRGRVVRDQATWRQTDRSVDRRGSMEFSYPGSLKRFLKKVPYGTKSRPQPHNVWN